MCVAVCGCVGVCGGGVGGGVAVSGTPTLWTQSLWETTPTMCENSRNVEILPQEGALPQSDAASKFDSLLEQFEKDLPFVCGSGCRNL